MSKLGGEPSQYMPTVVDALREIDLRTLSFGTDLLLTHKPEAKVAIPILQERLSKIPRSTTNLDEIYARDLLTGALHELAPETFNEARVQK